ncbi:gamma-glutamyltransferase [Mastigocoleus sp. MO_188.B34]|uniref:gamma-glutamyltransferase n=1 Tax=Mastigocoleus sp. MO_188.B34 TaxID=3036635 RepID=UPI00261467C8|nr:gamma-glutamyltransferase [Mastigocoleus sp. MO_188.B34]MDJ0694569.1 gamma-glutamyltransferase [Mastigocoleus sp. MO_188.B34]
MPRKVIIASDAQIVVDVAAAVANRGGNAVDAAIAATLSSMCTNLGIISPGASGFITIWPKGETPIVIDAYAAMPGRGLDLVEFGSGMKEVFFGYGGGMSTMVGYGSVAIPGIFAGLGLAAEKYGNLPWSEIIAPVQQQVARGFPLSQVGAEYLSYTHQIIFGWHPDSYRVIHKADGSYLQFGDMVRLPELATSLQLIAEGGIDVLYRGELGKKITAEIQANQGLLTFEDLVNYRAIERSPIIINFGDWEIATNPLPAIGGTCLAAMLLLMDKRQLHEWNVETVREIAEIQQAVLQYRSNHLEGVNESIIEQETTRLLEIAAKDNWQQLNKSPSTIHVSAVDSHGLACSISASSGYGSGVMAGGTGLWLNNSLGEIELHPQGLRDLSPGTRLISNMAPTVCRHKDGAVLAIGSPGASRITTAIAQVLFNFISLDLPLEQAISHPRLHFEVFNDTPLIAFETGLNVDTLNLSSRQFEGLSMYFGGVQAALSHPTNGLTAAADPRRAGSIAWGEN